MKVLVCATVDQWEEIQSVPFPAGASVIFIQHSDDITGVLDFDGYFILNGALPWEALPIDKPVFVNEVVATRADMDASANIIRINGWPGFLKRTSWEMAGESTGQAEVVAAIIGRKLLPVSDIPGLIAARVVTMIINEAVYASEAGVSTNEEIDLAMKLATNYPFGPFEWARKIGWRNIGDLLLRLSDDDVRYKPSFKVESTF